MNLYKFIEKKRVLNYFFIWLTIVVQIIFPITLSFIPNISIAKIEVPSLSIENKQYKLYRLSDGETVYSIANRYNISVHHLKKLNEAKLPTSQFYSLKSGDEIYVPLKPLTLVNWDNFDVEDDNLQQQKLASIASQIGNALSESSGRNTASSFARKIASNEATNQIQQWLNSFTTARVQLSIDDDYSFKNSQLDLLMPIYDKNKSLIFSQGSLHHNGDRFMSNLGLGYRWFENDWMLGSNAFIDYDQSYKNARMGLGIEYAQDFLKLSANSYKRLTDWKQSPYQNDYLERPANGWDIRAQTWLPFFPQLGGEIVYEQYYGKQVALVNKEDRIYDPRAITAGFNYTPIPLLTFSSEYKQGTLDKKDFRLGIQLNYQPNMSFVQQINPNEVENKRTLIGSRYDFVNRNNDIVFEYKKKELISLRTTPIITGYSGEKKSLNVQVQSKYGLEKIEWAASKLIAAGGLIEQTDDNSYHIVLPKYQPNSNSNNNYIISAIAYDKKGNRSQKSETKVIITSTNISEITSKITPNKIILPADGITQKYLDLNINDSDGNPVDVKEDEIKIVLESIEKQPIETKLTPFKYKAQGVYTTTLTASNKAEDFIVKPYVRNTQLSSATVHVTKNNYSTLDITPTTITAGSGQSTIRVIIRNNDGALQKNLEKQIKLKFSPDLSLTYGSFTKITEGVYETKLTGTKAGMTTITAMVNGIPAINNAELTIEADNHSATINGKISVTPTYAVVDDVVTYKAKLVDKYNNPLSKGVSVNWNANSGSNLSYIITQTNDSGEVQTTVTRSQSGTAKVSLILPSGIIHAPDVLFSESKPDESKSNLFLIPAEIVAGKEYSTLTLLLKDKNGNVLSGQTVKGISNNPAVSISDAQEKTDKPGYYNMAVTANKAGTATLSVSINNQRFKKTKELKITGNIDNWKIVDINADKASFTAGDSNGVTYSATVTDAYGNKLSGVVVSWHLKGQADDFTPVSRTNSDGIATTTVKSKTAGTLVMTAYVDDNNKKQAENVIVLPSDIDISKSSFIADKKSIGSNGTDAVNLTVILKDIYGNGISNKTIKIEGTNSLAGFRISPVTSSNDGYYQMKATSTSKGQVVLQAVVDGKSIGDKIVITIGAVTPDIRFANVQQPVIYTKNFTQSQQPTGIPTSVQQMWSSSSPEVASVNSSTGIVTLHKSGIVTITVQTSGNGQYNPTQASYELIVNKASPKLKSSVSLIQTKWNDSNHNSIIVSAENKDVDNNTLSLKYEVENTSIATINNSGEITKVKPGATNIVISTQETDQFSAEQIKVPYILNKGIHTITFQKSSVETNNKATYKVQSPNITIPNELITRWESSNEKAVALTPTGNISFLGEGKSRLTLTIQANEYYEQSSGYYDVEVYTKPIINVDNIQYKSQGTLMSSGDWKPFYKQDALSLQWKTGNKYNSPQRVLITLKEKTSNTELERREYISISEFENRSDIIKPKAEFLDKSLILEVIFYGRAGSENNIFIKDIQVKTLPLPDVKGISFAASTDIKYSNGTTNPPSSGSYQCRATWLDPKTHAIVATVAQFHFTEELLEPIKILSFKQRVKDGYGANSKTITLNKEINYGIVISDGDFGENSNNTTDSDCWKNHWGEHEIEIELQYRGKKYQYIDTSSVRWTGSGYHTNGRLEPLRGVWK